MQGYLFALLAAVFWGLIYAIRQKTLPIISPVGMMFINGIVSLACLTPLVLSNGKHLDSFLKAGWGNIALVLFAACCALIGTWLMMVSIDKLNASVAALVEISYPLFVVLFCWLFFGTTIGWPVLLGGMMIFGGSAVILIYGR